ncbi:MAG: hypothetical protein HOC74_28420 [Gemmatimonadetes bacterium]|jgi:hypothetical protein|nr:hypothetical protein [Gemmatimonadota bacterium]
MLPEFATFALLLLVLIVKYGTVMHTSRLSQDLSELEGVCKRDEYRYNTLCESKASIKDQQGELEKEKLEAERELNEVRAALGDQRIRNGSLEDRIEHLVN